MPIATAIPSLDDLCLCDGCGKNFPRHEMSVYNGICDECIDQHYVICSLCGTPVDHQGTSFDLRGRTHGHSIGDVWVTNGQPCCYTCYDGGRINDNDRWQSTPLGVSIATYHEIGSTRKFGVEIETSHCRGSSEMKGITKFGAKYDPTCSGLEFDSPVLYGDQGFELIRELLAYANDYRWGVNDGCGCHTHYDMRDESDNQLWAIYYAYVMTYPMWSAAVSPERRSSTYCQKPFTTIVDIERSADQDCTFKDYAYDAERYEYLNIVAYGDHRTFEVRLLEGTIDADTICNWLALHTRFIDKVRNMSFAEIRELGRTRSQQFKSLVELIDDAPLTDWLAHRARHLGMRPLRGPNSITTNQYNQ